MYSKFLNLNKVKQDKIINSTLKIFSNVPYKNASTDEIVREANISKGSLFNYFKSKKDLYLFVYDYSINLFIKDFYDRIDLSERDIFKRLNNIILVKLDLIRKYPDLFNFMLTAMYDDTSHLKNEINKKNDNVLIENYGKIFSNIDKSNFRNDINPDKAIEMILLTMDGYANRESLNLKKFGYNEKLYDKWTGDITEYIEMMKKVYYKGEIKL
jgi:AcrR family transcriptional regulator